MKFNFIKNRKIAFCISAAIILAGIISLILQGFNWDIDFLGGTEMEFALGTEASREEQEKIENAIESELSIEVSTIQNSGTENIIVKTKELSAEQRDSMTKFLAEKFNAEFVQGQNISASIGGELRREAIIATAVAIALMLVYIVIRFEIRSGLTAVIGLCHDVLIMLAAYTIFQIPINTSFIAAILTIIGYSINSAIIVLDRIRENGKLNGKTANGELVNISVAQTVKRTVNTTVTTLLTIGMVCIFGVISIKEFTIPLIVGIVSGLYSSIFLTGPIWELISKKIKKKK